MKKSFLNGMLFALIMALLLALTGCGSNKNKVSGNTYKTEDGAAIFRFYDSGKCDLEVVSGADTGIYKGRWTQNKDSQQIEITFEEDWKEIITYEDASMGIEWQGDFYAKK